ncbi:MAG TPA: hypothetical protein VFF66_04495 [Brevundimonas sp.]|nr:hypothetical protein [Brevundimonas sp.]
MTAFRDLHRSGLLILPNAWDGRSTPLMDGALGWGELNGMMPGQGWR